MINTLSQILNKKGENYLNSFLNEELIISEKIDAFRILFENVNGTLQFYKKDLTPINLIERVLSNLYEDALTEIEVLVGKTQLPEGLVFGLYYCPTERPMRLPYTNLPKYILTDVTKKENGKIIESFDHNEVKNWAAILCMARPPIIFSGKLSEEQKQALLKYDKKEFDNEGNLSIISEKLFGKTYSQENIIEGLIIQSKDKVAQIISYEFDILNEAYEKNYTSRDFYDLVLINLNSFMDNYSIPVLESNNSEELYLELISNIFNNYCKSYKIDESLDPQYLTPPSFGYSGKLNKKLISNKETLELINKSPVYESIFKILISAFRKYKKPYGLLSESFVEKFNTYVYLINNYTKNNNNLNENLLNEARSENIVIDAVKKRQPSDIDNMRVIASIQKAFEAKHINITKGKEKVAIYITTFQPFTNSQMNNIIQINNMWKVPVIIVAVSNKYKIKGNKFTISEDLIRNQMKALVENNKELIPTFLIIDSWNLVEIFEYCRPNYEPFVLLTDKGKKSEMTLQLYFEEEIMGGRIGVEKDFNIGEIENTDLLQGMRTIEDNNFSYFSEITPKEIHNYFQNIVNEYKTWNGSVLNIRKN